ncbi:hypothetical protein [Kitasatospora sp. DSM 101779]|uniref:hypothetical protein n=1 Tax=Kitasatospora sp. DSM 101779 TaxID=2853165 RepID=UPI0021DA12BF|nr:hypothetical protein [Kitasatospora sp. DSM 101779]MCU7824161.1 hypothetical protein [Kitasatospora sp. DSM 101779]
MTWEELGAGARAEVDDCLARRHLIRAVKAVRDDYDGSPGRERPGIHAALDVVEARRQVLGAPGPVEPTAPPDAESLVVAVAALPFRAEAIEAVWDGDTFGWFVVLLAVAAEPRAEHRVAVLRGGGDLRLFNGAVPPWPEAVEADRVGRALAEHLGVPFHFACPQAPDDAAPRWWEGA